MSTYKQTYPNSCGASCLLCGASELGVATFPQNAQYTLWAAASDLALNKTSETKVYQVTSNNPTNASPDGWGYSMPSGVVAAARLLGLDAWAVAYGTWTVTGLKFGYSEELARLRSMNALVENSDSHSTIKPVGHQRELRILVGRGRANFGALHYVMLRGDGTVMEPGDGQDYSSIDAAKTAVGMHGTGLSVFVQR